MSKNIYYIRYAKYKKGNYRKIAVVVNPEKLTINKHSI